MMDDASAGSSGKPSLTVGVALFPGYELLDVYGPLELFGLLREQVAVHIHLLALEIHTLHSAQGPVAVSDQTMADCGELDVLLVPGGVGTRAEVSHGSYLHALEALAARSKFVTSVCTGSALLAKAGLLDGKRATSNKRAFDWAVSCGPAVDWVRAARWVVDGNTWTSSGISAGMDMTLALIEHLYGRSVAEDVASRAEYLWNDDPAHDPFA